MTLLESFGKVFGAAAAALAWLAVFLGLIAGPMILIIWLAAGPGSGISAWWILLGAIASLSSVSIIQWAWTN